MLLIGQVLPTHGWKLCLVAFKFKNPTGPLGAPELHNTISKDNKNILLIQ